MKNCKSCGDSEFYANGQCKPCKKIYYATWIAANRERELALQRERSKAHYIKNQESEKKRRAEWRNANPQYSATYCAANAEKANARAKKWAADNPEKVMARNITNYANNTEKIKSATASYQKNNPDKKKTWSANRRAKVNGGKLSTGLVEKLYKLQRGKCVCCGKPLGDDYHLDHRMPLALDGANEDWNMQLLTATCNQQKSKKHPINFMQSKGFLL